MTSILVQKLFPLAELKKTATRFPFAILCALLLFFQVVLSIHDVIDLSDKTGVQGRLMVTLAAGFFWFALQRLLSEGRLAGGGGWTPVASSGIALGGFALLALALFGETSFSVTALLLLLIPALLLGIACAPFIFTGGDLAFWFYNQRLWLGVAVALLAGLVLGGGVSAALASIGYLFEIRIDSALYGDIWSFALLVLAPLYALSWIPDTFAERDCYAPPPLAFLLNWIFAPLVVIYMLILYAYFIKIALLQQLPRGQLSYLASIFGALTLLTYIVGWPLRERGGPLLTLVYRLFPYALIVPVAMQGIAIYRRIEQYGVTEQRYVVVLITLWLALLVLISCFKKLPLKWFPGLLALLLVVAAIGPVSATKVAEQSQFARLQQLLTANGLLLDGRLIRGEQKPSLKDRKSISSILTFLQRREKLQRLTPWLVDRQREPLQLTAEALTKHMGFDYVYPSQEEREDLLRLHGKQEKEGIDVAGFDYLSPRQHINVAFRNSRDESFWHEAADGSFAIRGHYQQGLLRVALEGTDAELTFDIPAYLQTEMQKRGGVLDSQLEEWTIEQSSDKLRVRLLLLHLVARTERSPNGELIYSPQDFSFQLLVASPGPR